MSIHFLAVLGTNLYEPVKYQIHESGKQVAEHEFVQIAMLENIQNKQENIGKITIFLTEGAKKSNWEDRKYTQRDIGSLAKWVSAKREMIQEGAVKPGMKSILQNQYPQLYAKTEAVDICNASTEEEIWSVFETIYNTIEDGDEIVFDITQSFRSIPMLAITIINYAKVLKNCQLRGIYYGHMRHQKRRMA